MARLSVAKEARTLEGLLVAEHVVGDATPGRALPLVVSLHGRGGTPELPFGEALTACRVLVPRGPFALGEGHAWSPRYAREGRDDALASDLSEVAGRLARVVGRVRTEHATLGRTIVLGFSQGAMLGLALADRQEAAIGELVLGAAWVPSSLEPSARDDLRIRMAHGSLDAIVPYDWAEALATRLSTKGLDMELRRFPGVTHASSPDMNEQLGAWRDEALGRAVGIEPSARVVRGERAPRPGLVPSTLAGRLRAAFDRLRRGVLRRG